MALRIHEIHPSVVHFPLALLPAVLAMDAVGRASRNRALMEAARRLMPVAAASGLLAGVAGLAAQSAVHFDERSAAILRRHRALNAGLVVGMGLLAAWRFRRRQPDLGYLAAGLAGFTAMNYSAYLGGRMVYSHGVGVKAADGVVESASPEIRRSSLGRAARRTASNTVRSLRQAVGTMRLPMSSTTRH